MGTRAATRARVRGRAVVLASLCAGALVAPAAAQSPAQQQALVVINALAAQVETRAATLTNAGDLPMDTVSRLVGELDVQVSQLIDAAAPYPPLNSLAADMRAQMGDMTSGVFWGSNSDVETAAAALLDDVRTLRVYVRNMAAGPFVVGTRDRARPPRAPRLAVERKRPVVHLPDRWMLPLRAAAASSSSAPATAAWRSPSVCRPAATG